MFTDRWQRVRTAATGAALAALLLTASCSSGTGDLAPKQPEITEAAARTEHLGLQVMVPGTLAADFAALQSKVHGSMGLAIMPVNGERAVTFGEWKTGPAWSTMKVPLAIAAGRATGSGYSASLASAAIISSDNDAADALWQSLGKPTAAAAAVQAVLREGGDTVTAVPEIVTRSGYSAFGQAEWALTDQVKFAAQLPCMSQTGRVTAWMEQVTPIHQWGLGAFPGAEFKGGWGPDPGGAYLVRQFGLVPTATGRLAVAFAAQPDSGEFNDGMTMLDRMTTLISKHLDEVPGGQC